MESTSHVLSENLPTGGGSLCDCEGGLPKNGGGLAKGTGGLAQGKRKYAEWIQREVDGVGRESETESESESEMDEEDGEFVTQERIDNVEGWDRVLEELYAPGGMKAVKTAIDWQRRLAV
jgi:hypothetical protein